MLLVDWQELVIGIWFFLNGVYLVSLLRILDDKGKLYNIDKPLMVIFFPVTILALIVIFIALLLHLLWQVFKKSGWLYKEWK
jgi:hypothetical protein